LCTWLNFLLEASSVVFLGPPGTGKTHLSIALALQAAANSARSPLDRPALAERPGGQAEPQRRDGLPLDPAAHPGGGPPSG
jgi:hypothetical protein